MAVATLSLASCSDDDFLYQDQARVRLVGPKNYTSGTDSLKFSFATYTEETTEMNMDIDVCVMGTPQEQGYLPRGQASMDSRHSHRQDPKKRLSCSH